MDVGHVVQVRVGILVEDSVMIPIAHLSSILVATSFEGGITLVFLMLVGKTQRASLPFLESIRLVLDGE